MAPALLTQMEGEMEGGDKVIERERGEERGVEGEGACEMPSSATALKAGEIRTDPPPPPPTHLPRNYFMSFVLCRICHDIQTIITIIIKKCGCIL